MKLDCPRNVRKIAFGARNDAGPATKNPVTGPALHSVQPLRIGDIEVANRVLLAPMSGITDAPFRRLAASLGAGLVVSEMTASDDLVHGRPMSVLRCEAMDAARTAGYDALAARIMAGPGVYRKGYRRKAG